MLSWDKPKKYVVYLTKDFKLVDKDKADLMKVVYPDGKVSFFPAKKK